MCMLVRIAWISGSWKVFQAVFLVASFELAPRFLSSGRQLHKMADLCCLHSPNPLLTPSKAQPIVPLLLLARFKGNCVCRFGDRSGSIAPANGDRNEPASIRPGIGGPNFGGLPAPAGPVAI